MRLRKGRGVGALDGSVVDENVQAAACRLDGVCNGIGRRRVTDIDLDSRDFERGRSTGSLNFSLCLLQCLLLGASNDDTSSPCGSKSLCGLCADVAAPANNGDNEGCGELLPSGFERCRGFAMKLGVCEGDTSPWGRCLEHDESTTSDRGDLKKPGTRSFERSSKKERRSDEQ